MQTTIKLKELKCPACTKSLAHNLQKIEYIKEVNINYDRKEITIEGNRDLTEAEIKMILDTVVSISHCPFHNKIRKLTRKKFQVVKNKSGQIITHDLDEQSIIEEYCFENIDCPNCALKVEHALNKIDGVIDAKVNFINKKIIITHLANVSVYESVCAETKRIESDAIVYKDEPVKKKSIKVSRVLFYIGLALFVPLIIYYAITQDSNWYMYVLFGLVYLLLGYQIIFNSFKNIIHGQIFDENFLMLIASIGAFFINEPVEAILVILLYRIGEKLQAQAIDRSTKSIEDLMTLKVEEVMLENGNVVPIKEVKVDDIIIIKAGDLIPLDGIIIEGESSLDTKSLTGESLPQEVKVDDEVLSGTVNLTKNIKIRVTKEDNESTISKVVKLIDDASNQKSKTEKFITKFARIYTPIVLALAVITGFVLYFGFRIPVIDAVRRVLVFLVVSCPCALVISVPLGFFAGIGKASSYGILVKGGNYLEALSKTKTIFFDKTGTLSEGNFVVDEINTYNKYSYRSLLKIVAHIEAGSNHPIAKSICSAYHDKIDMTKISNIEELSGYGLKGNYEDLFVIVGNAELLKNEGIKFKEVAKPGSVVYCAINGVYAGYIVVVDELKPRAGETINFLKRQNIKSIMLSGDSERVVQNVQKKLGIDEAYGKLLPKDKLDKLREKVDEKKKIVYVGDGINDTPCLKIATVGIAMGAKGSDIAKNAADIVIMNDDIGKIIDAINISSKTMRIIYQNIVMALVIKGLVLVLSTLNVFGKYSMLIGVLSDVGLCLIAILNTLRIIYPRNK